MSPPIDYKDWIAPQFLVDIVKAFETPKRAAQGEEITPQEAINVATNVAGGGFAASGSAHWECSLALSHLSGTKQTTKKP
jgi:hypothetical protein